MKMDYELVGLLIAFLLWVVWAVKRSHRFVEERRRLPPGPWWWEVAGTLGQSGWAPHKSFSKLAAKHGSVMSLQLGSMGTVVVSSSRAAREMFKNHDGVLAGRKIYEAMKGGGSNEGSLITAQYGPHWRMLRRLCTHEFFVASRLDATRGMRDRCIDQMIEFMKQEGGHGNKGIDVGRFFFLMAFNLISNLIFSKDLVDPNSEKGAEFFYHAGKVMELAGKPNLADFLPILRRVDPQGIRRNTQFHVERAFRIAGEFIDERMKEECCGGDADDDEEKRKDYLSVLLGFRGDGLEGITTTSTKTTPFSSRTINVIVFEMFTAGTDTTTSTLEWAMAELLHNPKTLERVQAEVRGMVAAAPGSKLQEKDLDRLPYLQAVIKETLRLHPPLPFLVPHKAMDACNMGGYHIPKDTQILVNVWAIGRDPNNWKDPTKFNPDRFLEEPAVDFKGHHFEFIPFGSGRRMCPAVPLASRILPLALGSVLHSFDWVLSDGVKSEDMDMAERMGITLRKSVPLMAVPIPSYKRYHQT